MTAFGVIRQIGESSPFIYCMCETKERAESIAKSQEKNSVVKNSRYWVEKIQENANTGDYLYQVRVIS